MLTQAHISALIAKHFEGVNFMQYQIDDGVLVGVLVDHPYEVELPNAEDFA